MGKGAKIAIGCVVAVFVVAGAVAVAVFGAAWWGLGKVKQFGSEVSAKTEELARYEQQANANPFQPPADGVVPEDRLLKFLEVRKQMYAIYQAHAAEIEAAAQHKEANLSDIAKFGSLLADLQLAKAKGLAAEGMSDGEYIFLQMAVYRSSSASQVQQGTGKQFGEILSEAAKQSRGSLKKGIEAAEQAGYPTGQKVSDEDAAKAEAAVEELAGKATALDVPQANIDLFRKHQAEIEKYAMQGLTFMGL